MSYFITDKSQLDSHDNPLARPSVNNQSYSTLYAAQRALHTKFAGKTTYFIMNQQKEKQPRDSYHLLIKGNPSLLEYNSLKLSDVQKRAAQFRDTCLLHGREIPQILIADGKGATFSNGLEPR